MNAFLHHIKQFLSHLSLGQQIALGMVVTGGIALLVSLSLWAGKPDYVLLFGKLGSTDASKIVEALKSDNVKFDLRDNGTSIFVPRDQVYELRLKFAGNGLVSDGTVGYELFDGGTMGMTDFMQKLNLKRALEGELARTISSIKQVELCRVHLVMPERSPFREAQTQPSASVVLQLVNQSRLTPEQIAGITELVAGAVEGLTPADVTVLDTRGSLLSNPGADDPDALISSTQLRMQRAIENHLTKSGQTMLDQVLGPSNSIVRVAATLDFNRSVAERETIDPESATVISEEKLEEQDVNGGGNANSSVRNYALSRTNERSEKSVGDISYLTVSVILNSKRSAASENADQTPPEPTSYSDEELQEIESLVKNAVGFNPERGDRFAIHQTRFDTSVDDQIAQEMQQQHWNEQLQMYLRYALMILALLAAFWLIRSATRRASTIVQTENPFLLQDRSHPYNLGPAGGSRQATLASSNRRNELGGTENDLVLVEDVYTSKLSPDAQKRLKAKHIIYEEIKQQVSTQPQDAAELIRSWMAEDKAAHFS